MFCLGKCQVESIFHHIISVTNQRFSMLARAFAVSLVSCHLRSASIVWIENHWPMIASFESRLCVSGFEAQQNRQTQTRTRFSIRFVWAFLALISGCSMLACLPISGKWQDQSEPSKIHLNCQPQMTHNSSQKSTSSACKKHKPAWIWRKHILMGVD